MEMDSVIAAANPAATSTVFDPPPAITPRMIPRMLTRPSCPPRMTSRNQLVRRWPSRWRDEAAAAALRRHAGVTGQRVPREEAQQRRAVVDAEGDPLPVVLLDGPAETLAVELLGPVHVPHPERDAADVWLHRHASSSHRPDRIRH